MLDEGESRSNIQPTNEMFAINTIETELKCNEISRNAPQNTQPYYQTVQTAPAPFVAPTQHNSINSQSCTPCADSEGRLCKQSVLQMNLPPMDFGSTLPKNASIITPMSTPRNFYGKFMTEL